MCGILVYLGRDSINKNHSAITSIKHRGPDFSDTYHTQVKDNNLTLGHTRLSIIDLTQEANQPMHYNSSGYWIVFNGEIYNYIELRKELIKLGYKFYTASDTEVLIASYIHWGKSCLDRFNGMFSFAIWNEKNKELFIARDRYGVKPLYYINNGKLLCFSSELKQIQQLPGFSNKIKINSAYQFLEFGDFSFDNSTLWEDIEELEPGHFINIKLNDWVYGEKINQKLWYNIFDRYKPIHLSKEDAIDKYKLLFEDSIKLRLRSDVPIGFALSGGIDSSALVAYSSRKIKENNNMSSFTLYSNVDGFDEREYATQLINGLNLNPNFVEISNDFIKNNLESLIQIHDLPMTRMSIIGHYQLCKLCDEMGIKVLLEGQGPDEVLAGYEPFFYASLIERLYNFEINDFFKDFFAINKNLGHSIYNDLKRLYAASLPKALSQRLSFKKSSIFYNDKSFQNFKINRLGACYRDEPSMLGQHTIRMKLLRSILHNVDRAGMGNSIEIRNPFLDYRLMELSVSLPTFLKINRGYTKYLLRESMRGTLPDNIIMRTDKMGFSTPESSYVKKYLYEIFNDELENINNTIPFINGHVIKDYFNLFLLGKKKYDRRFWRIVNYSIWSRLNNVSYG